MLPRNMALLVLCDIFENHAYSNMALKKAFSEHSFDERDRRFISALVYGSVQYKEYLDYQIANSSKIPLKKLESKILNILRMAVYQIFKMDKVPESAAVNEAVKQAKKADYKASGFVNGVLRNILRCKEVLPDKEDKEKYFSVLYSYPEWLVKMWAKENPDDYEKLLSSGNEITPVTLRVNNLKTDKETLKNMLSASDGVSKNALDVSGDAASLKEFEEGFFTVQDSAAQEAVLYLDPQKNEKVLDACAAPGGKTTYIGELMENTGEVTAWDIHPHKLILIEKNAERLSVTNIKTELQNAGEANEKYIGYFDRVLCDVPCSGLGIIRKKPDIKWQRKEEDIDSLTKEQYEILNNCSAYVKHGGTLLYSTCTVSQRENIDIVNKFLKEHKDFTLDISKTFYPHKDFTDGFFVARLLRENKA